ncbi:transposase IS4 family protein [Deinococcus proteolyticus MRP]|uniref:Transposase IS4 family protein n=2 Tax=Deinococcus proteolyticus (strain ATCC 35074 / DSM 20540 / JCM 6276 / NBRC 101906 / NCIMB 13154 / VKM Ac-1939 / CCM 2703 / MRP) TaxID=693977 RepID=F0RJH2_DEIPM|nr:MULTISPECIES: IS982 family transposase [Deinococcus]ADY25513.1 transposase IS4 family protein [Deinococcus proteolyticus MRP]MCY1701632.1 IS982 family transposase [Deinococcus sp. SL84]MCY1703514.1 IS982 family transposase [Deinococcus sp. SL84]
MGRPDLTLLPIHEALQVLSQWVKPHIPAKLLHKHEKISDADLIGIAILQMLHKQPYFSRWWHFLTVNHFPDLPSETQARIRLKRLLPVIEHLSHEVQSLDFVAVDSEPLPVCTFKRAPRCKFRGARHGFSTAGPVFGFKLHAWCGLNGEIVAYNIRAANEHDYSVLCEMNRKWPAYGGPQQIGDKGYQSLTTITPPKVNARRPSPRWREEFGAARKCIESAFSVLVGAGLRWGQVKTMASLKLKVALHVLAHNLKYRDLIT